MVYNYKKQRSPIVPMYTILGSTDVALEKNGANPEKQIRKVDGTPAPNSYSLPDMVGKTIQSNKRQAPCYSLTGRFCHGSYCEDFSKTPGPGTYNTTHPDVFKDKAPHYSMTSRNGWFDWWYSNCTPYLWYSRYSPGPGTYSPEHVIGISTYRNTSKYSFGIRHKLPPAPIIVDKPE